MGRGIGIRFTTGFADCILAEQFLQELLNFLELIGQLIDFGFISLMLLLMSLQALLDVLHPFIQFLNGRLSLLDDSLLLRNFRLQFVILVSKHGKLCFDNHCFDCIFSRWNDDCLFPPEKCFYGAVHAIVIDDSFHIIIKLRQQIAGVIYYPKISTMQSNHRKNKFHSHQSFIVDEDIPNYLSAFVRSHHSPSYLEIRSGQLKSSVHEKIAVVERQQERERSEYDELKNHYECIEKVLNEENLNLKMQAKYLASEMRKSLKREKLQKEELKNINELYEKTNNRLTLIMQQNLEIKEYVESKIIFLLNSIKLTNFNDLVEEIKSIIQQFCEYFSINLEFKYINRMEATAKVNRMQEENVEISEKIEQLNDRFEELMHEYKSNNRPEIRKQCIDIAKEIKFLKVDSKKAITDANLRVEKTVQQLSRQQSNEYLSIRSKQSKNGQFFDDDRVQSLQRTDEKQFSRNPTQTQNRIASRKSTINSKVRPSSFRQTSQKP